MFKIIFGIFIVLHGLVHLLYFGQSARYFELQPKMVWPVGSWVFAKLIGDEPTRILASILCILAASAFIAGGLGILLSQEWWRLLVIGSAAFSIVTFVLFWNGAMQKLADMGGIGFLINLAILVLLPSQRWSLF